MSGVTIINVFTHTAIIEHFSFEKNHGFYQGYVKKLLLNNHDSDFFIRLGVRVSKRKNILGICSAIKNVILVTSIMIEIQRHEMRKYKILTRENSAHY